ncbi:hypothetical protein [Blastopirellula marina]|uniref:Uncharacterized protein n=1 Tax=Blastopirellula marina TaxID=124 RepID=A0A2S8G144_9BACT|nr:hypothetical protein [Blastopirellula marina]PQO38030.1 hypothetical protein C5Y98_08050 [Blastopirellula marina]PTL44686.1 hypothetical protein C5Y97_08050 [Blastopirellula marina]
MKLRTMMLLLCVAMASVAMTGCGSSATNNSAPQEEPEHNDDHDHDHSHAHSHAESGPHGGHLIELGDEAYHLEWKHDDSTETLTFFLLDGAAKEVVKIPAESISINVAVGDATRTYEVPAVRDEGEGKTDKFEISNPDLFALIEDGKVKATVLVEIETESYQGPIEHHHHGHSH